MTFILPWKGGPGRRNRYSRTEKSTSWSSTRSFAAGVMACQSSDMARPGISTNLDQYTIVTSGIRIPTLHRDVLVPKRVERRVGPENDLRSANSSSTYEVDNSHLVPDFTAAERRSAKGDPIQLSLTSRVAAPCRAHLATLKTTSFPLHLKSSSSSSVMK